MNELKNVFQWNLITLESKHKQQLMCNKFFHSLIQYSYLTNQYNDNDLCNTMKINRQNREDIIYAFINDDIIQDDDIFISCNIYDCYTQYTDKVNINEYIEKMFL